MSGVSNMYPHPYSRTFAAALAVCVIGAAPALAQPLAMTETSPFGSSIFRDVMPGERAYQRNLPRYETTIPADEPSAELPAHLRRQIVSYPTREAPGTIVI